MVPLFNFLVCGETLHSDGLRNLATKLEISLYRVAQNNSIIKPFTGGSPVWQTDRITTATACV